MLNIATSERNGDQGCASSTTTVLASGAPRCPATWPFCVALERGQREGPVLLGIVRSAESRNR